MLFSMALTSFLTGVTEPIEFSFMFLAPLLYAIHAVLTGIAMALMHALGVHLGFGFSAGLFDYVLNFSLSTRPLLLIPVGLGVLRAVLRPVPLLHRALRSEDAGPRNRERGGRRAGRSRRDPRRRSAGSGRSAAPAICARSKPAPRACGWWSPIPRCIDERGA